MINEKLYFYFHDFDCFYKNNQRNFILELDKEKWEIEIEHMPTEKKFELLKTNASERIFLWSNISFKIKSRISSLTTQNIFNWINPAPNNFKEKFKNLKLTSFNSFDNSIILEIVVESAYVANFLNSIHKQEDIFNNTFYIEAKMIKIF